jgi:glycosyltransferase involved in cell wall biosynthesis/O-antigen/teichoic acid export membrane protein
MDTAHPPAPAPSKERAGAQLVFGDVTTRRLLRERALDLASCDGVDIHLTLHLAGHPAAVETGVRAAVKGAHLPGGELDLAACRDDPVRLVIPGSVADELIDAVVPRPRPAGLQIRASLTLVGSDAAAAEAAPRVEEALAALAAAGSTDREGDPPGGVGVGGLLRSGAALSGIAAVLAAGGNLVFHAVASRVVGPADYGALGALLAAMLALAVPLTSVQVAVTRVVARAEGPTDARELYRRTARWSFVFALVVAVAAPAMGWLLRVDDLVLVAAIGPYVGIAVVGAVGRGVQTGRRKVGVVAGSYVLAVSVRLVVGMAAIPFIGIRGAVVATLAGELAATWLVVRRDVTADVLTNPRVRVSSHDLVATITAIGGLWLFSSIDVIVARSVLPEVDSGLYVAASNAARVLLLVPQAILIVALPRMVPRRAFGHPDPVGRRTLVSSLALTVAVCAIGGLALVALAQPVLELLYGSAYRDAVPLIAPLAAAMVAIAAITVIQYREVARRSRLVHVVWCGAAAIAVAVALHHPGPVTVAQLVLAVAVAQALLLGVLSLWRVQGARVPDPAAEVRRARAAASRLASPPGVPAPLPLPQGASPRAEALRVLVLAWRDPWHPAAGGAEVYLAEVTRRWAAWGHDVTWFSPRTKGSAVTEERRGVRHVRHGSRFTVYRQARRWWVRQPPARWDLVLETVNTKPFGAIRWASDVPVVGLIHQVADEVWAYEAPLPVAILGRHVLEPRWLRQIRHMPALTVSASSRASLEQHGFERVHVVPEGIEVHRGGLVEKAAVPTVVFCGRLVRSKRPDDVIDAFRLLRRQLPTAELVVIGRGPLRVRLESASPPGVRFADGLDDRAKLAEMARAHVLVATSVREGWGLVVSEAASVGVPTVAYDVAGLRDSAAASGGYVCEPTPEALAATVAALLERWATEPPVVDPLGGARPWDDVAEHVLDVAVAEAGLPRRSRRPRPVVDGVAASPVGAESGAVGA